MLRCETEERPGGTVARLTLDHPARLNIFTRESAAAIAAAMRDLGSDPRVRAVVVAGAGKAFCGGADLETLGALDPGEAREFIGRVHDACAAMRDCPVPVVARIHGACLGAGLELAAACDLRLAADTAVFGMPEVRLAIPSVVEAALLPRLIGIGRARWLVLTGETIGAREALEWGLVEKVFALKDLDSQIEKTLDALLAGDPEAMRTQKRLCRLWEEAPLEASVRASVDEFARAYESEEPRRRAAAARRAMKARRG